MKGPRPLNANNQIPLAEVIRQLLALVNGVTPHRGPHHCRSNTVQPGLELLQRYVDRAVVIERHHNGVVVSHLGGIFWSNHSAVGVS